jgi:hypothetical protein
LEVQVGDVWWLPEELAAYPGGKSRFCLVVALEAAVASQICARAHYVVGSTSPGGQPEIVVEPGEANLPKRTHFRFWLSSDIGIPTLIACGKFRGRLDAERRKQIGAAIRASRRTVLKRLAGY